MVVYFVGHQSAYRICSAVPPRARVKLHRKQRGYKRRHVQQRVETSQQKCAATTFTAHGNRSTPSLSHPWPGTHSLPTTSQQTVLQTALDQTNPLRPTKLLNVMHLRRAVGRVGRVPPGKGLVTVQASRASLHLGSPGLEGRLRLGDLLGDVGEVADKEVPHALRVGDAVERFLGVHLWFKGQQHRSTRGWLGFVVVAVRHEKKKRQVACFSS